MHQYNQSLAYDRRMYKADVKGSIAYAKALTKVGIISADECVKIEQGLKAVEQEWAEGKVRPRMRLSAKAERADPAWPERSSTSSPTTRISTRPTSAGCPS